MRALSIRQPWVWAILEQEKRIENRTWDAPDWILGQRIAIHASKKVEKADFDVVERICGVRPPTELVTGAIVATAVIDNVYTHASDKWFFGPYGWRLNHVTAVEPIPCRGHLGLWNVPGEIVNGHNLNRLAFGSTEANAILAQDKDPFPMLVPLDVAVCLKCGKQLEILEVQEWDEDGVPNSIAIDCTGRPKDIGSSAYNNWENWHWQMPYVDWLPLQKPVLKWLNGREESSYAH